MMDIPDDILRAAYVAVAEAGVPDAERDLFVLVVAQSVVSERDRAAAHVAAAAAALKGSIDGSPMLLADRAIEIVEAAQAAIVSGAA